MRYLLLNFCLIFTTTMFAQVRGLPEDFTNIPVVESGLSLPTNIAFDMNGQGYICEKGGIVRVLDTLGKLLPEPLIDISEEVVASDDHGLIGFALHPDFLQNGYFYLLYTVDRHHLLHFGTAQYDPNFTIDKQATIARITRFRADPNTNFQQSILDTREVLLGKDMTDRSLQILMSSHAAGDLEFGASGDLYVSFGDSGSFQFGGDSGNAPDTYFEQALEDGILLEKENVGSFRSQLIDNLGGKILRINSETGEGIPENPFFDSAAPNAPRSKVYAMGFRNPFRFFTSTDEVGRDILYVGDVGSGLWEEMNLVREGGENFGWPMWEGMERRWEHDNLKTPNLDAPNPLFDGDICQVEYFSFPQLFLNGRENHDYFFENPCDSEVEIPKEISTFYHTSPMISWSGTVWNPPTKTEVPGWSDEGDAIGVSMSETDIEGEIFDGFSAIPAFIYDGKNFPAAFQNKVFVSDFSGWIRTFELNEKLELTSVELFMDRDTGIVDLKINPKDGCIYYPHIHTSSIHKVCYGGTPPPVVEISTDVEFGNSPLRVQFDAGNTFSPTDAPLDFSWDFGDGLIDDSIASEHVFTASSSAPESFEVTLTVSDSAGNVKSKSVLISVNNSPPIARISSLKDGDTYPVSDISYLKLEAEVIDNEHGTNELNYTWQTFFQHNIHFHEEPLQTEPVGHLLLDPSNCEATETFWYRVKLTVEDAEGLTATDEVEIYPFCDDPFFEITELNAEVFEESIKLNWEPTFENDVERFEIERTEDFRFETIASVLAEGESIYFFEDKQPITGNNFYRLKVVRKDGAYEYSPKLLIRFPPMPTLISIFPNPTEGIFQISTEIAFAKQVEIEIFDLLGKKVFEEIQPVNFGEPFLLNVDFNPQARGIYICKIQHGFRAIKKKLLINR